MSASFASFGQNVLLPHKTRSPGKEADRWNLLLLFSICYSNLLPSSRADVSNLSAGGQWLDSSHRHRYVPMSSFPAATWTTDIGVAFHRFFSHAAWDLDVLSMHLAKLVVTILTLGGTLLWAVDDTCVANAASPFMAAACIMIPSFPAEPSRSSVGDTTGRPLSANCSPFWAPSKVFALPIAFRLYRNRQGLTKGKKGKHKSSKPKADPNHHTRPQLARRADFLGGNLVSS